MLLKNLLMKSIFKNLIKNSAILSIPGLISIFISLISIPIHLNYAGQESYGNYIIFHFILMISICLNFGIGKSATISINNHINESKKISFQAIIYTTKIASLFLIVSLIFIFINKLFLNNYFYIYDFIYYLIVGFISTIFFITFEGILQGYRKFKSISVLNLFFFSLSFSVPSVLLIYKNNLSLDDLILISIIIKFLATLIMFIIIKNSNLIKSGKSLTLLKNLKKNSKWITLNSILIQFYDLFDKYLIKIFFGPIALASYSIPQQLTGKLTIISKSFSAFLLPDLSKSKIDNQNFEFSLKIFIKIIPVLIFCLFPFFPTILEFWLGDSYSNEIFILTKIFSLSVILSCASHILITKFEAQKILSQNLKIEFLLMPVFLFFLFFLTINGFSLISISILILFKELILFFLRLNCLKNEINELYLYYIYPLFYLLLISSSFLDNNLFYVLIILLILSLFKK